MDNSLKGLILAAGTIITCIVIGLGFYIAREARDTASSGAGQISKLNAEFNESDKVMYDGLDVSGSEVINLINKYREGDISIKVKTKKSTVYYGKILSSSDTEIGTDSNASVKDAQKSSSVYYINQNAQFTGEVLRDSNNSIIGISFIQI
ncbi:hypothetical protein [Anaeromicropila herbilytica]|uniref:Uncharacterized protein n=1 Tax=Anaeromicropila herbilytica TaxID=2785025 RepID=A0A7R7ICS6_9FIRM|nr:hypothetical protein [Anaeromicropila herbilytica]BCN30244.1 hypothetical protein bsdtb5_15390 [Anaeromicropila herbilytica]